MLALLRRVPVQRYTRGAPRHAALSALASPSPVRQQAELEDEYKDAGHDDAQSGVYRLPDALHLEKGGVLEGVEVAYTTYGELNAARDNAIVLCHALTGHSQVHQWWDAMVKPEWTDKYFLVCSNILGSCYGTTGPATINPATQRPYGPSFPAVTLRDAIRVQKKLLQDGLGVQQVRSVVGGSLGGMQTLEWGFIGGPDYVKSVVPIACNSHHSAWQIAMSEVQRQAIYMDPNFQDGHYDPATPPHQGLALARQIAMISYRTHAAYRDKYGRDVVETQTPTKHPQYQVQSYLSYQGQKFLSRFDVNSFVALTHMMDMHDVGRGRGGVAQALSTVSQPALVVGVETDVLYPLAEQLELAEQLPHAAFHSIASPHGHDGFLLEQDALAALTTEFLAKHGL
ncbi:hypothetical protein Poli38472_008213 [Pythium oligandrum]|uniref:AB hydrolase-1 domain-containing protein n=1 Tax=Pythium oligandrum TaxID=41045 RepID=A0A8K1CL08_PYTOL|nr:hypothetical protein Poli38472_008213 [Pythium oligandrum]|eukprot:TMW65571.1 hypothetical protein Poli38472_008213 [Pythium oligandrum]